MILLTGGKGFLGGSILEHLGTCNIVTLARGGSSINCDLSLSIPVIDAGLQVELLIHAAGKAHFVPTTKEDRQIFYHTNVQGTKNLLKGLVSCSSLKKFVFISSVSVYGLDEGVGITEDSRLSAIDPYDTSKVEAEKIVMQWCKERGVICTILRLPLIAGPNPPGNLRAMIEGIQSGYYFNIAGGYTKKSMVLASDVAKYILPASEVGGIYNLTDGYHPCFKELSDLIAQQLNKKPSRNMPYWMAKILAKGGDIIGPEFPINSNKLKKIISTLTFDDSKARQAFGWNPTPVLEGFKL